MHILVVEDNQQMASLVEMILQGQGYRVTLAKDAAAAHAALRSKNLPDLILLDMVLPDEDGIVLARQIRTLSTIPIMVVSGREKLSDRLAALELGVDDYMVKPFSPDELLLRVRNLLSRWSNANDEVTGWSSKDEIVVGEIKIDIAAREVRYDGCPSITLTGSEFDLLLALAKAPGVVLSRDRLLDAINRGNEPPTSRVVDVLVGRVRKKLRDVSDQDNLIETVPGIGYRLHRP